MPCPVRLLPEPGVEGTLDCSSRVSALVRDPADRIFLLEREPSGQGSEPVAGSGKSGASGSCVVPRGHAVGELESAPADGATSLVDEAAESLYAVLSNKRVRVLRAGEQPRLEHTECRRFELGTSSPPD
jgi:hypothetical protein